MTTELDFFITKRDGSMVKFDEKKIHTAIHKAMRAIGRPDSKLAEKVMMKVMDVIFKTKSKEDFDVEDVQDAVEQVLIELGIPDVAKAYILYRDNQRLLRVEKCNLLNKKNIDEVDKAFDLNSLRVLASRYLLRNDKNEIIESPKELFIRVATHIGLAEIFYDPSIINPNPNLAFGGRWDLEAKEYYNKLDNFDNKLHIGKYYLNKYHFEALIRQYIAMFKEGKIRSTFKHLLELMVAGHFDKVERTIDQFYNLMVDKVFLPNTPTLMNAGARLGQLSACFVLGMKDSLPSIMKTATDAAIIFQSGGGVGINYGQLRSEGDIVSSTSGVASGPVSFMQIVNTVTDVVKQGGKRRGANMGIVDCWHNDIEKFITAKTTPGVLENFNVSVGVWDDFWDALINNKKYTLRNPRNSKSGKEIDPRQLLDTIALSAWKSAEPGVIFFDNINKDNPMIEARGGPLTATNPCGEQSLYPYESCNLGSINLAKFVRDDSRINQPMFDWDEFESVIRLCVRFLDNVIDVNKYPIDEITKASRESRRIGLGIMGLADMLSLLRIPYNSRDGYDIMDKLAETLSYVSTDESVELAKERGEFDLFKKSTKRIQIAGIYDERSWNKDWVELLDKIKQNGLRNSWNTTIAPTGSLSMIADCSNGVEPTFSIAFEKHVAVGKFYYANKIFKDIMTELGIYSEELLQKVVDNYGTLKGLDISEDIQQTFVTAMDMHWIDHVVAQAVWQKWIGNAIAKTINMPNDVTSEDIRAAYLLAHDLGLKGVTVYRDGSRHEQVLHINGDKEKKFDVKPSRAALEYIKDRIEDGRISKYVAEQVRKYFEYNIVSRPRENIIDEIVVKNVEELKSNKDSCPVCSSTVAKQAGCGLCLDCGWSGCSSG